MKNIWTLDLIQMTTNKTIKFSSMIIAVRALFLDNSKNYPQIF